MKITQPEHFSECHGEVSVDCLYPSEYLASREISIPVEHQLEVLINEIPGYRLVCSPDHLTELVLGRLLSEGVITTAEDVELIYLCDEGLRARVFLKPHIRPKEAAATIQTIPTCCTDNRTLSDCFRDGNPPRGLSAIHWKSEWIFALSQVINTHTPLHAITHSVHSCALMHRGEVLVCHEDIGRHNAMDKTLGWALLHQIPLQECILYTSGRIPVDMASKVIRAGVPVLVSKSLPTEQAVQLAQEYGLTLIGAAYADSMRIFTRPKME